MGLVLRVIMTQTWNTPKMNNKNQLAWQGPANILLTSFKREQAEAPRPQSLDQMINAQAFCGLRGQRYCHIVFP